MRLSHYAQEEYRLIGRGLLLALLLASCGVNRPPPPASPHSAPARDLVVRTGRFAIHVNAYVAFYARVFVPRPPETEASVTRMDQALVARLGACSDDVCARAALAGTAYGGRLDAYLLEEWPDDADDGRRAVGAAGTPLMGLEDLIAPALASQIGRVWPNEPVEVFLARAPGVDPSGRDGPLIDTQGECFGSGALLECLFTRAVEVLLPESDLGRGIEEARAKLDERALGQTDAAVPCVAALAVDAAVSAADRHHAPTSRFGEACAPSLRLWLGDMWARRIKGDIEARSFGVKLIEALSSPSPR